MYPHLLWVFQLVSRHPAASRRKSSSISLSLAVAVREGEAGGSNVIVGEVKPHAGARRDSEDFVEVAERAAGKESEGQVVKLTGAAKEIDGLVKVVSRLSGATGLRSA